MAPQPRSFQAIFVILIFALAAGATCCSAILAQGEQQQQNQRAHRANDGRGEAITSNLTLSTQATGGDSPKAEPHQASELDANSTFYYEADAFLQNGPARRAKQEPERPAGGRSGRMLDLDALVGDLATSRANREARAQITSRQSRNLPTGGGDFLKSPQQHHLDIGGGKRLHIQGFIPIVGVRDEQEGDQADEQAQPQVTSLNRQVQIQQQQRPKMLAQQQQQLHNDLLPYGQSSIGHASFNVQRLLDLDQAGAGEASHRFVQLPPQQQQLDSAAGKGQVGSGGFVNSLKKPIKRLASSLGGLEGQPARQGQNCLCVPFYMCKNGLLSESGLNRAQVQQLMQQQQPRQLAPASLAAPEGLGAAPSRPGSVESVPTGSSSSSYANSLVPVDERSFERDIVTAATPTDNLFSGSPPEVQNETSTSPQEPNGAGASPQELADATGKAEQATNQKQELPPEIPSDLAAAALANASANPNEMTSLDQASEYSQDILGRMLGLKQSAASLGAGQQQQAAGGVCGLLRTCCAIPASLQSASQQQQFQDQLWQQSQQLQQVALQRYQPAAFASSPQVQPPQSFQQISRAQFAGAAAPPVGLQQQLQLQQQMLQAPSSLAHRTSSLVGPVRPVNAPPPQPPVVGLQQYSRATHPQPALQSFQQQPAGQLQQVSPSLLRPPATIQQQQQQVARVQQQLGTRKLLEGRCGLRQSAGINGRVQNLAYSENAADFGEYPAQAAILKRLNGTESLFVCGGTLISQSWVATAAHCIRKHLTGGSASGGGGQLELKVRLGEWDVHRDDEFYPFVEREVRDLIVHPEFVPGNLINDLALLRLDSPLDPSLPHVNPACLPTVDESFAKQRCWVTGWGKDSFGQRGSFQAVLQEVELPVLGQHECESQLRQTRLGPHYRLHPGFICAGGEGGKDACEGDGGSGLYCAHEGVIKVAGLVSWGIGCGQQGVPGVYVNLAQYRPWIENIISIDEDVYSPYAQLPVNSLISERSMSAGRDREGTSSSNSSSAATTAGVQQVPAETKNATRAQ